MSKSQQPDLSKKPQGATHWVECKDPNFTRAFWAIDVGTRYMEIGTDAYLRKDDVGRSGWTVVEAQSLVRFGELLPPPGVVCQFIGTNECRSNVQELRQGAEVTIIAHYMQTNDVPLAAFTFLDDDGERRVGGAMASCFGPLKTAEQIAAEERLAKIEEMMEFIYQARKALPLTPASPQAEARVAAEALYEASFRRQVAP